jgi:hypothetical protein
MIETTIAILLAASLTIFGAYCIIHQFRRRDRFPQHDTYGDVIELPCFEGNIVRFPGPSNGTHNRVTTP